MSDATVAVVRRMNEAFNEGRYEDMLEMWHADADFTDHLPLPDVPASPRGREELRSVLREWNEGFKVFQGKVEEYVDLGDFVVAVTTWRFVSADEQIETEWPGAEAWQVRDGKVVWGQTGFRDREAAIEAVGERRSSAG
jgi:ketosteroid isomerase-like protein